MAERRFPVGLTIAAWSRGGAIFPIEAAFVWVSATFSCVPPM